jgi:predicted regulator of Ras-like GTPase activity (Roadblock/LC7/MglB family)
MSFHATLSAIVEECSGCVGAVLMGNDGISIAEYVGENVPEGPLSEELGTAGVEFTRILEDVRKASDALLGGQVIETVVVLSQFSLAFRTIDEDAVLVVILLPDGNLGKARYLMRRHLLELRQEL